MESEHRKSFAPWFAARASHRGRSRRVASHPILGPEAVPQISADRYRQVCSPACLSAAPAVHLRARRAARPNGLTDRARGPSTRFHRRVRVRRLAPGREPPKSTTEQVRRAPLCHPASLTRCNPSIRAGRFIIAPRKEREHWLRRCGLVSHFRLSIPSPGGFRNGADPFEPTPKSLKARRLTGELPRRDQDITDGGGAQVLR